MKKDGFTLVELLITITIIGILASVGLGTFTSAQKKSRDSRRKNDLATISKALEVYNNDHNATYPYPADDSGQIKGCTVDSAVESVCSWGSAFQHADTTPDTVYLIVLPDDPSTSQDYYYDAAVNRKSYQLYARLENTADPAVPKDVDGNPLDYGISCGASNCNYGISSSNVVIPSPAP